MGYGVASHTIKNRTFKKLEKSTTVKPVSESRTKFSSLVNTERKNRLWGGGGGWDEVTRKNGREKKVQKNCST